MNDSEVLNRLPDYLEDNLSPEEKRRIEAHLVTSEPCREELAYLRRIQALSAHKPILASPGLWKDIAAQIQTEQLPELWNQFAWVGKRLVPILAAAAVLVIALLNTIDNNTSVFTIEDYLKAQWDGPEAVMLSTAEISQDDVLYILHTR